MLCSPLGIFAQNAGVASGGEAEGNGGTVSYTVGQTFYQANTAESVTISEGVQQAYEISVVSGVNLALFNLEVSTYPNPTSNFLTLKVAHSTSNLHEEIWFSLYSITGEKLLHQPISSDETRIEMQRYVSGIYLLNVENIGSASAQKIKTFKIIKN